MYGVGLPYLNSVVREPQTLQKLRDDAAFKTFVISEWRSRSLLTRLLQLRFSKDKIKEMTTKQLIEAVYQCSVESEYRSAVQEKQEVKDFAVRRALPDPEPAKKDTQVKLVLSYLKTSIFKEGCYYTMPRDLFTQSILRTGAPDVTTLTNCAKECLDIVLRPDEDIDFEPDTSVTFIVTDTAPEHRHVKAAGYIPRSSTDICVVPCDMRFRSTAEMRIVVTADNTSGVVKLNLLHLMKTPGRCMQRTFRWVSKPPLSIPVIRNVLPVAHAEAILPIADVADEGSHALAIPNAATVSTSTRLEVPDSPEDVGSFIVTMGMDNVWAGEKSISFFDCPLCSDSILRMRDAGILEVKVGEFSEMHISLRPSAVQWRAGIGMELPLPISRTRLSSKHVLQCSKLELLIAMREKGWTPAEAREELPAVTAGSTKYIPGWHHPKSYFAALVQRDSILAKIVSFEHRRKDGYYRCLLKLDAAALARTLGTLTGDESDDWFKRTLAAEGGDEDDSSGDDAAPRPAAHEPGAPELIPIADVALAYRGVRRHCAWIDDRLGDAVKVYFDHFTGGGDAQRSYCCCTHHADCIRWRPVNASVDTVVSFCARMYAWNRLGLLPLYPVRTAHMSAQPTEEDVAACVGFLQMVAF